MPQRRPRQRIGGTRRTAASSALESHPQQVKDQDDHPSHHSEDGTDSDGKDVDRDVIRQEQVRQKEEDHPKDRVDYECQHDVLSPSLVLWALLPRSRSLSVL